MRKILISLLTVVLSSAVAVGATRAYFTDLETNSGNTVSVGTLVLNPDPATPGNFLPFTISNMKPGDGLANEDAFYYRVNLRNDGTLNLKYRVRVFDISSTNELYNALRVKVGEYNSGQNKVLGTALTLADLENGILVDSNVIPTVLDTRVRTVWFRFYLPTTVGNEIQGQSINFNIAFDSTQTNNPAW